MKETIETTDIFKGAYFLCCGADMLEARVIKGIVTMDFEAEEIHKMENEYNNRTALVNPQKLRAMINVVRDVVYQTLREETAPSVMAGM